MCYQVWTHTLRCAARPLIFNGEKEVVDSYAVPTPCSCEQRECIKPRLRCDHHGCCMITAKILRCDNPYCNALQAAHLYAPSSQADLTLWQSYPVVDAWFLARKLWADAYEIPGESIAFRKALNASLGAARMLTKIHNRLLRAREVYVLNGRQWDNCSQCGVTHDPFNCWHLHDRFVGRKSIAALEKGVAIHKDHFYRSNKILESLQEKGERKVAHLASPLNEDPVGSNRGPAVSYFLAHDR